MVFHSPAVVVALSAAIAFLFLIQVIHVLKNDTTQMFFLTTRTRNPLGPATASVKLITALMYGIPGCAILALLITAAVKTGPSRLLMWFSTNFGMVSVGCFFLVIGLVGLLRPELIVKGASAAHPSLKANLEGSFTQMLTRLISTFLLGFGLFFLAIV
jgi:hypothetical protein